MSNKIVIISKLGATGSGGMPLVETENHAMDAFFRHGCQEFWTKCDERGTFADLTSLTAIVSEEPQTACLREGCFCLEPRCFTRSPFAGCSRLMVASGGSYLPERS